MKKIFCTGTGPIIAAKDEQKSPVQARQAQRSNQGRTTFIDFPFSFVSLVSIVSLVCPVRLFQLVRVGFHDYLFPTWRAVYCVSVSVLGKYITTYRPVYRTVCAWSILRCRENITENYRFRRICTSHREWQHQHPPLIQRCQLPHLIFLVILGIALYFTLCLDGRWQ
jgi:hypothetical protein